jgi:hypothetical protein
MQRHQHHANAKKDCHQSAHGETGMAQRKSQPLLVLSCAVLLPLILLIPSFAFMPSVWLPCFRVRHIRFPPSTDTLAKSTLFHNIQITIACFNVFMHFCKIGRGIPPVQISLIG